MSNTDKQLTQEQLAEILDLHVKWLSGYRDGVRADLCHANLQGANLDGVDLEGAFLRGVNLRNAELPGADLRGAHLAEAQLRGADLRGACVHSADMTGADLRGADMCGANLRFADLRGADLTGTDMRGADLYYTLLEGVKFPPPVIDLSGCKVGYKKVWNREFTKQVVIELKFPEGAKLVSTVIGRKCRASEAIAVRCLSPGYEDATQFWSMYDDLFPYKVGETMKPTEPFDDSIAVECTSGIHFFITREEAERYVGLNRVGIIPLTLGPKQDKVFP